HRQQGADFAYERLTGTTADLSLNPGQFQLPLAQNRGARSQNVVHGSPLHLSRHQIPTTAALKAHSVNA
ncbi:hypothetical protein ACQZ4O_28100, partial [Agrobacterium vitis]